MADRAEFKLRQQDIRLRLDNCRQLRQIDLGLVGRIFGSASEKPGNLAAFVVILSIAAIFVQSIVFAGRPSVDASTLRYEFVGLATLALGYLFGRKK